VTENEKKIIEILTKLAEVFQDKLSEERQKVYLKVLKHYNPERIQKASDIIISTRSSHWFPLPAEITSIIHEECRPEHKTLSEPEPTQEELTHGQWQCRFAVWLMGVQKTGTRREPRAPGVYSEKSVFKQIGPSRWREAETQKGRQNLWNEFCRELKVPEKVASVPIN